MKSTILFLATLIVLGVGACSRETSPPPSSTSPAATPPVTSSAAPVPSSLPAGVSRVENVSEVCMVTDQFMGKAQIPVDVEGRTYYGCCPMCKERLNKEPAIRVARDPVSGEEVDKAKAVIVKDVSGKILYFASEDTLRRYRG